MKFKTAFLAALLTFLVFVPSRIFAQAISGDITGSLLDPSGAAIADATVTAENTQTGVKTSTVTRSNGEYRLSNLPVGVYNLTATAPGFAASSLKGFRVELNKVSTVNLTLAIGAVSTAVEVAEASTAIDTTTAQIQTSF